MNMTGFLLADLSDDLLGGWKMDHASRDFFIISGALAVLTLILLAWAAFVRKRKRTQSTGRSRRHSHSPSPSVVETENLDESRHPRRKWRRRRREHRPRNPTLAETGGLPPIRPEEPGDSIS
jgi:hypothetical protein